jgi:hypothetical protein
MGATHNNDKSGFFACYAASDRVQQVEIQVINGKRVETGVVYPDFKTAWKILETKNHR